MNHVRSCPVLFQLDPFLDGFLLFFKRTSASTSKQHAILFSYRVSQQASTKYSPFYLMYGRQARLPIEFQKQNDDGNDTDIETDNSIGNISACEVQYNLVIFPIVDRVDIEERTRMMVELRKKTLVNIEKAQEKQNVL